MKDCKGSILERKEGRKKEKKKKKEGKTLHLSKESFSREVILGQNPGSDYRL